jgi:hypothetical protein
VVTTHYYNNIVPSYDPTQTIQTRADLRRGFDYQHPNMDVNHSSLHKSQSDSRTSARHDVNNKTGRRELPENHVRLVRILPGRTESLVHCETRIFALPVSSGYTALSYAWGPPVAEHAIVLNGRKHLVAKNLWHFLTTWRSYCAKRAAEPEQYGQPTMRPCHSWLWIDALSIDQNNMQERNHQVKIMSSIFGGADEVLVWLGPAKTGPNGSKLSHILTDFLWDEEICERMYWTRLWVFQELKFAKQTLLMCGGEMVRFSELADPLANVAFDFDLDRPFKKLMRNSVATRMMLLCGRNAPSSLWLLL